jgi:hypothetical protein
MELNNTDNDEIRIYSTKLSKAISIIFIVFHILFTAFLVKKFDIRNEENSFLYVIYFLLSIYCYYDFDVLTPLIKKPQIILSKTRFWTKKTDWLYWKDISFVSDYTTSDYKRLYYCYVYLKDLTPIEITADYSKEIVEYTKNNFYEKYIPKEKRGILSDLITFRERYSVTDGEFEIIAKKKLNDSI